MYSIYLSIENHLQTFLSFPFVPYFIIFHLTLKS